MTANARDDERDGILTLMLILPGRGGMGWLKVILMDGWAVSVRLEGRYVKVLLILNDALRAGCDWGLDEVVLGWRTDAQIADIYGSDDLVIPPEALTIRAYRSQIHRRIRQAMPAGRRAPRLFLSERDVGVRLVQAIEVIRPFEDR